MAVYRDAKNGTWYYYARVGKKPDGRWNQKVKRGFRTKAEAKAAEDTLLAEVHQGSYVEPTKQTVTEYLDTWLEAMRPPGPIRQVTWDTYRYSARYAKQFIGGRKVADLTGLELTKLYGTLLDHGRGDGKPLSPWAVRNVHKMLRRAFQEIPRNPALQAKQPSIPRREGLNTWTVEECRIFLAATKGHRFYAVYAVALATGFRRSEVLGLRWQDVDFDKKTLTVAQGRTYGGIGDPKSKRSGRTIDVDDATLRVLREHRIATGRLTEGLVFVEKDYPLSEVTNQFKSACRRTAVRVIRLHDLRHTHATLMRAAGADLKLVQERLGHSSLAITADLYTHAVPGMQADMANKVGDQLWGTA